MDKQLKQDEGAADAADNTVTLMWQSIRDEVSSRVEAEPTMAQFLKTAILDHESFEDAIATYLAGIISTESVPTADLTADFTKLIADHPEIVLGVNRDLKAIRDRDPACTNFCVPFLFFKGFHALQLHRIAWYLWQAGRIGLASYVQYQVSVRLAVDIHPAAQIGTGVMLDHGTGLVVGETAVVEDNVSILQGVTLGGTGKETGQRHPKVREGVLIGAGAKILGNVEIGRGAKVGAGSVVLADVPEHVTVAGVPAKIVGQPDEDQPAFKMDHLDIGANI